MVPTGVLTGQIMMVFTIVLLGLWSATQWTAAALGYQLRLGRAVVRPARHAGLSPVAAVRVVVLLRCLCARHLPARRCHRGVQRLRRCRASPSRMSVWRARQSRLVTTYGSARWALPAEIRRSGLTGPAGVFLGRKDGDYLRHEGPEHVMAFAPTRSGKGVGLVVPTLLSWPGSAVIHDIKGENWQLDRRLALALLALPAVQPDRCALGRLQPAARSAARHARSTRRAEHRRHPGRSRRRAGAAQPLGEDLAMRCWSARSCMCSTPSEDKTLRGVANFLSDPACPFEVTLHRMMTTRPSGRSTASRWSPRPRARC